MAETLPYVVEVVLEDIGVGINQLRSRKKRGKSLRP